MMDVLNVKRIYFCFFLTFFQFTYSTTTHICTPMQPFYWEAKYQYERLIIIPIAKATKMHNLSFLNCSLFSIIIIIKGCLGPK